MIDEFSAKNYGCLRDVTVRLTPLHAFIGPNDSGKSTLLRAVRLLARVAARRSSALPLLAGDPLFSSHASMSFTFATGRYRLDANGSHPEERWASNSSDIRTDGLLPRLLSKTDPGVLEAVRQTRTIRLRPDVMHIPTQLIEASRPLEFLDEFGLGLAAVIDAIRDRNDDGWRALLDDAKRMFPNVARLQLQVRGLPSGNGALGKTLAAELVDGTRVPVEQLSEGFLYFMAFAALRYMDPVSILCVEEPENGLHPARIREVVRVLRDLTRSGTQVLLTTHSPLVVNELDASEVTVLTRPPTGTLATRLNEVPFYRERVEKDGLLPGEFWVSYCDGEVEAPLLDPKPHPDAP